MPQVRQTTPDTIAMDVRAAVKHLHTERTYTVGFCFGGRNSFNQAARGHGLAGVIGFYGRVAPTTNTTPTPRPSSPADTCARSWASSAAPTRASRRNTSRASAGSSTRPASGTTLVTYEGAPHSFFDRNVNEGPPTPAPTHGEESLPSSRPDQQCWVLSEDRMRGEAEARQRSQKLDQRRSKEKKESGGGAAVLIWQGEQQGQAGSFVRLPEPCSALRFGTRHGGVPRSDRGVLPAAVRVLSAPNPRTIARRTNVGDREPQGLAGEGRLGFEREKVGEVEDVYFDVETDQPRFLCVKAGWLRHHAVLIPVGGVTVSPDHLTVAVTKAAAEKAPAVELGGDFPPSSRRSCLVTTRSTTAEERLPAGGGWCAGSDQLVPIEPSIIHTIGALIVRQA